MYLLSLSCTCKKSLKSSIFCDAYFTTIRNKKSRVTCLTQSLCLTTGHPVGSNSGKGVKVASDSVMSGELKVSPRDEGKEEERRLGCEGKR